MKPVAQPGKYLVKDEGAKHIATDWLNLASVNGVTFCFDG